MELVLRPKPRNTSHRILGTSPVSSELDIPNETDIPRVLPYRITDTLTQVVSWVAPVSSRHYHRMAPTIAWHKTCPKRGRAQNILAVKATAVYPAKPTATRSLPILVNTHKERPPVDRIKACPYRQLWLHE